LRQRDDAVRAQPVLHLAFRVVVSRWRWRAGIDSGMAKMIKGDDAAAKIPESDERGTREELRALLEEFDTAMLVTKDDERAPRARPMAMRQRPNDTALWFVTAHDTAKVEEIERDPMVAAVFYREHDCAWISVSGRAALVRDVQRTKELWSSIMKAWFDSPEDPNIMLIRVEPHHAEFYEPKGQRVKRAFELVKGVLMGAAPELGPVKHVTRVELTRKS
jgi:general stress protein 26